MNLAEYEAELQKMIETHCFDQRSRWEHLATLSPEHLKVWEDFLILEHALPAWKQTLPEVDLVESVLTQLQTSQQSSPSLTRPLDSPANLQPKSQTTARWVYLSMISVAVLLVLVSLKFVGSPSETLPHNSVAVSTNVKSNQNLIPTTADTKKQSINNLLRNAGAASWGLAQSTAGAMTEVVTLVPVTQETSETATNSSEESNWVEDINSEMQPLKDQISHAWNFIIHSVPDESTNI